MEKTGERSTSRVRVDKKRDVRPTIHTELKDVIYDLSAITGVSVMDLVEEMTMYSLKSKRILSDLSPYFVRDLRINNILYVGHRNAERLGPTSGGINFVRVKTRLNEDVFSDLSAIAYALDVRIARACAILIEDALHCQYFLDGYIKRYLTSNITDHQLLELKKIFEYVNREENFNVSWAGLLSYIVREVKEPMRDIKEKVSVVIKNWRE
ncbi:hypothetical protein BK128_21445 [Viridibacillus sp. FSL H7-0596]|uniref:hypothetical protein n=1 Tax=Viridibacillus sp. FSL H7-0596 TaxID=1928923 RepID=UPI00096F3637|nr:hypothetical protein [Viridibacillus sp. FSL H7-0596]OMC81837.1 hypothetical protein BK128_21445 [Viridibacillus sp. FSL H7-0596]